MAQGSASQAKVDRIFGHPRFQELVRRRSRFARTLTLIMVAAYGSFILSVAFAPAWLARPLAEGPITRGMAFALGVAVLAVVLTGLYVRRANVEFDGLTRRLFEDLP